jgi:hypothetical protein
MRNRIVQGAGNSGEVLRDFGVLQNGNPNAYLSGFSSPRVHISNKAVGTETWNKSAPQFRTDSPRIKVREIDGFQGLRAEEALELQALAEAELARKSEKEAGMIPMVPFQN